jgi:hypothetical protein
MGTIYGIMIGVGYLSIASAVIGYYTVALDDIWDTPLPFIGALLWPLLLPAVLPYKIAINITTKMAERKRFRVAELKKQEQEIKKIEEELEEELEEKFNNKRATK